MKWITAGTIIGVVLALSLYSVLDWLTPYDSTDDTENGVSNMRLYTDHGTGCQYLATGGIPPFTPPALTPRLGADGRPLCGQPVDYYPPGD